MKIHRLTLDTASIESAAEFYGDMLGLPVASPEPGLLEITIGASVLCFRENAHKPRGIYHFAFNVPKNQFVRAGDWLTEYVPLLASRDGMRSFHSSSWNADMVYFRDMAGNIAELIARQTLDDATDEPFGPASLSCISEIGIAVDDVPATMATLTTTYRLPVYHEASDTFASVGDERGLFIVVQSGRMWYPEQTQPALPLPITVTFEDGAGAAQTLTW